MRYFFIVSLFIFTSGCVTTGSFNETTGKINEILYILENRIDATERRLSQLQSEILELINSDKTNNQKLELIEVKLRRLDEVLGELRLQLIRNRL